MSSGFWRQIFSGKTVYRASLNLGLAACEPSHGKVLDIGGTKRILSSYRQYIRMAQQAHVLVLNIDADSDPDYLADGAAIPCVDGEFDTAWCINTIEHVPHPDKVVSEAYRVLKKGGVFIFNTPFIYRIHRHPEDYSRFTDAGLKQLAMSAGFQDINVVPIAVGVFQSCVAQLQIFCPRFVFPAFLYIARSLDAIVKRVRPELHASWVLGFIAVCKK